MLQSIRSFFICGNQKFITVIKIQLEERNQKHYAEVNKV